MSDNQEHRTPEERIKKFEKMYDMASDWLWEQLSTREGKGTGAACNVIRCLREEVAELVRSGNALRGNKVTFEIPGLDFAEYEKEKPNEA